MSEQQHLPLLADDKSLSKPLDALPLALPASADASPRSLDDVPHTNATAAVDASAVASSARRKLSDDALESIVKVYSTHCEPEVLRPWQMKDQTSSTASGFVLPGRRVLTNAHAVEHGTLVRVKRRMSDRRYVARVVAYSEECDLALLSVEDSDFWESPTKLVPFKFGNLPRLRDSVVVVGYPLGGDGISVTAGVVSRIELQAYSATSSLLAVQIDAAINHGNSGGPALDASGNCVGVAFMGLSSAYAENIGYLIPVRVVAHFLADVERHGCFTGCAALGFRWAKLEAPAARRSLGLPEGESGVYVRSVPPCSPAAGVLKKGDIVTHVDDTPVSNSGMVLTAGIEERISMHVLITDKFIGDECHVRVFRNGAFTNVKYPLPDLNTTALIPMHKRFDHKPPYFIFGGLVFLALSGSYFNSDRYYDSDVKNWGHLSQVGWLWQYGEKECPGHEVVMLAHVLDAEINIHYEKLTDEHLQKVNGVKVRNLKHLVRLVQRSSSPYVKFEFLDKTIVLDRKEAVKENQSILDMHHISSECNITFGDDDDAEMEGNEDDVRKGNIEGAEDIRKAVLESNR